jgi:hypothetical protein
MHFITAMKSSSIQLSITTTLQTQRGKPQPTAQNWGMTGFQVSNTALDKEAEIS